MDTICGERADSAEFDESYSAGFSIGEPSPDCPDCLFTRTYIIKNIKIVAENANGVHSNTEEGGLTETLSTTTYSIADLYDLVKIYDKDFKPGKTVDKSVLNEDGTPKVFYHGMDADFSVFDPSKGRSAMDIQGMFFSPWELDAGGHGENAGAYYLSIQNTAPEGVAYKALNRFKGQNDVGYAMRFISNNNIVRVPLSSRKSSLRRGFFSDIRSLPEGNDFMSNKT